MCWQKLIVTLCKLYNEIKIILTNKIIIDIIIQKVKDYSALYLGKTR